MPLSAIYPSLKDKRVVVTGGASGIGASIVAAFARQGAEVFFLDILDGEAARLAETLSGVAHPPAFHKCDLTDISAITAFFKKAGPIDILVNNAGNDDRHKLADITPAYWDERIAVNLRHMLFCAKEVAPGMKKRGGGAIINFGSISWHLAMGGMPAYTTAKAGIEGLTRSFARDLGGDNIRVNCVIPGWIMTERQKALWLTPEAEAKTLDAQCIKRLPVPDDVARMVLWLAADDSRMCTSQLFTVDGGWW